MILNFENVTKYFGGLAAVKDVSFQVQENQILGLIGPNGSGKTTCFNLITGVYRPTSGKIVFKGEVIDGLPSYKIARKGISRTFQISSIYPALTTHQNVLTAHHTKLKVGFVQGILGLPGTVKEERIAHERSHELLEFVGLQHLHKIPAGTLTSADQRRLMVAIALASKPQLLMLDEPCAGMTRDEQINMINLIRKVCDQGTPVLLVEHHMRMIMEVCDHVVVLNLGQKIAEGCPNEIQNNEAVIQAYLGRSAEHNA
ncbi:MAG: ABC transporter ATP-binding protein [Christensenellales bacterium]|jgi:branched-chain amino acid transport system ATP-binding protein